MLQNLKNRKYLVLINKIDLESKLDKDQLDVDPSRVIEISIKDNIGIDTLKNKIMELFHMDEIETIDPTYLSNSRSISILKKCLQKVEEIKHSLEENCPIDMIEMDIKSIWEELGTINGSTYEDELLDEMFARFCLGK